MLLASICKRIALWRSVTPRGTIRRPSRLAVEQLESRQVLSTLYGTPQLGTIGSRSFGVAVGDVTGDGFDDVLTTNFDQQSFSVLRSDGRGGYDLHRSFTTGVNPRAIATGDFNRDGWLDVAVTDTTSVFGVSVYLNRGPGDGSVLFAHSATYTTGADPRGLVTADFDNDGITDFATANRGSNDITIYWGRGDGTFGGRIDYGVGTRPEALAAGRMNGDGTTDIVVANTADNRVGTVLVLPGRSVTIALPTSVGVGLRPTSVAVGDLDLDGRQDIVVSNADSNNVTILIGNGDGSYRTGFNVGVGTRPQQVVLNDFDRDGDLDIGTANDLAQNIAIITNRGDSTFAPAVGYATGDSPFALAVGDLNADGAPDIAVSHGNRATAAMLVHQQPSTKLVNGVLTVLGTEGDDNLTLRVINGSLSVPGFAGPYWPNQVREVRIYGRAGNDVIDVTGFWGKAVLHGGPGRDTMHGGDGGDLLYGNDDNDHLDGHGGSDTIYAGAGDDYLVGGAGFDYLLGMAGNDYVVDDSGNRVDLGPDDGYSSTFGYGLLDASYAVAVARGSANPDRDLPDVNAWNVDQIRTPEAWEQGARGQGVVVAVLDTGVNYLHPDLVGRVVSGWDFVNNDNDPMDDQGHGTHVAGTIAANANGFGITGIAPEAKIMPIKVINHMKWGYSFQLVAGIRYAVDHGAHVINMSLGADTTSVDAGVEAAVQYAYQRGVVVVMSAGNYSRDVPGSPAVLASSWGLAVGAIDVATTMADFSNRAGVAPLDYIVAPGVSVTSTSWTGSYELNSGTSMAAPHVAGVAALLRSANPALAVEQIEQILVGTARFASVRPSGGYLASGGFQSTGLAPLQTNQAAGDQVSTSTALNRLVTASSPSTMLPSSNAVSIRPALPAVSFPAESAKPQAKIQEAIAVVAASQLQKSNWHRSDFMARDALFALDLTEDLTSLTAAS